LFMEAQEDNTSIDNSTIDVEVKFFIFVNLN